MWGEKTGILLTGYTEVLPAKEIVWVVHEERQMNFTEIWLQRNMWDCLEQSIPGECVITSLWDCVHWALILQLCARKLHFQLILPCSEAKVLEVATRGDHQECQNWPEKWISWFCLENESSPINHKDTSFNSIGKHRGSLISDCNYINISLMGSIEKLLFEKYFFTPN